MPRSQGAALVRGDATAIPLADESVDLIVTSPPYFALRSYQDGGEHYDGQIGSEATPQDFLEALWAVTAECWRVLKPSGSLWVNLGDKYAGSDATSGGTAKSTLAGTANGRPRDFDGDTWTATGTRRGAPDAPMRAKSLMGLPWRYAIGCIDGQAAPDGAQWILRAEVVWSKPNGLPESVTDRVRRSHEQWFHFTKAPRYYSAIDEIREVYTSPPAKAQKSKANAAGATKNPGIALDHDLEHNPLGKLPGSVWSIPSEPLKVPDWLGVDHFAAFPQELPRRIITGWSPPGVCTACGEGRRPVVAKEQDGRPRPGGHASHGSPERGQSSTLSEVAGYLHTITGYECACPDTDAPTTPAVVLDPFGGTGTTAMVARALGRFGVSLDLSADYLRLAEWRIFHSGHASKTRERANRDAQGTLL